MPSAGPDLPSGVAILGAGAIGCLLAARLARRHVPVTLVGRPEAMAAIREHGLTYEPPLWRSEVLRDIEAVSSWEEMGPLEANNIGLVVLTTKVHDTAQATVTLAGAIPPQVPLLALQSGVGGAEVALGLIGERPLLVGVTTYMAVQPRAGVVRSLRRHGGLGLASVSAPQRDLERVATQMADCGLPTRIFADFRVPVWSKLLLDLPGNAVPAIVGLPPQGVFSDPALCRLEVAAFREALTVMRAQGVAPADLPGYPVRLIARGIEALPLGLLRRLLPRLVTGARSGKPPSLQTDLERGRVELEVDYINGAVARAGVELGVPVPANALISRTLVAMARGDIPRDAYVRHPHRLLSPLR